MASSAAAFVEGGVQDACEDACSICLETFTDADPAVVTCCKHEYHLQCIIEWSQRSKECPMCWQALSLKDPDSQELLAAVEHERAIRQSRINVTGVFPPEGYEFHRLAAYGDDSDFEERMMRHLALVTMGRRQFGRRDGNAVSVRPPYGNMQPPQFVIVPAHGTAPSSGVSVPAGSLSLSTSPSVTPAHVGSPVTPDSGSSSVDSANSRSRGSSRGSDRRSSPEGHSFSDSLKSRLAAASSRYKESFSKTTKSFRDKLRMRNGTTMADIGARAREVSAGVVRALERISLDSPEKDGEDPHQSTSEGTHDGCQACGTHGSGARASSAHQHHSTPECTHEDCQACMAQRGYKAPVSRASSAHQPGTASHDSVNIGSSKIVPQSLPEDAENKFEEMSPPKNIDGSTGPALEGQQMHLVPMSTST